MHLPLLSILLWIGPCYFPVGRKNGSLEGGGSSNGNLLLGSPVLLCFEPMLLAYAYLFPRDSLSFVLLYSFFKGGQIDSMYLSSFCSLLFFPRLKMPSSSMSEYSHQVWMPSWKPWRIWPASPGMWPLLRSSSTWMASHSSLRWWKAAQSKCTQPWCLPPSTRKLWGPLPSLFRQCLSCYPRSTLELWCLLSSLFWKFPDVKTRPWPSSVKSGLKTAADRGFCDS